MKEIIDHLRGLADGSIEPGIPDCGLCCELEDRFGVDLAQLTYLVRKWPEHSGYELFPVPARDCGKMYADMQACGLNMWNPDLYTDDPNHAEYCRARRRLCAWLADYLEERQA